ncbi:MAG: hypothetical protein HY830_13110, partial [Actinobacteria bacterium]|nr:hypothetical protein [Actinomycetota bacterium]
MTNRTSQQDSTAEAAGPAPGTDLTRGSTGSTGGGGKALLGVAVVGVLLILVGVGLTLAPPRSAVGSPPPAVPSTLAGPTGPVDPAASPPSVATPASTVGRRVPQQGQEEDVVASRQMPSLPLSSATPGPVSTRDPGPVIVVPDCPDTGPAGVQTGCPHTRAGALAQLIAIDRAALQSGTMAGVREVIAAWALPGGPTTTSWSGVHAMAAMLSPDRRVQGLTGTSGGTSGGAASGTSAGMSAVPVVLTPVMGLFKGHVGDDFVVPCVGYELAVTITRTARV